MQILLANAKIMYEKAEREPLSTPLFQPVADMLAAEMARMEVEELARQLDCNPKIAATNRARYRNFPAAEKMPAILAYNGQAYKHLRADTLSGEALEYAQNHLWITCFLYGLLRPLDGIVPYRMEHCVTLEATQDKPVNQFWKDKLTQVLIDSIQADDGILIHLSTEEYEHLFDWKRVCREVQVVHPLFYVRQKDGDDIGDDENEFCPRVHVVDEGAGGVILPEGDVIEHCRPPSPATGRAPCRQSRRR